MNFDEQLVRETIADFVTNNPKEQGLDVAFVEICRFLYDNPDRLVR